MNFQISKWFDGLADFEIYGPGSLEAGAHLFEPSQCIPRAIAHRSLDLKAKCYEITLAV